MMTLFVTNDFMYTINLFVRSSHNQDFIFKLYVEIASASKIESAQPTSQNDYSRCLI